MAIDGTVPSENRRAAIRAALRECGAINLQDVAAEWDVHPMTIRRDLDALEREGVARRVRGGAVYVGPEGFESRSTRERGAKRTIAAKLRAFLPEGGGSIALDASSTLFEFASSLPSASADGLTVLTQGIESFTGLQGVGLDGLYLTGGRFDDRTGTVVGPLARNFVASFSLDVGFISTTALDSGFGTSEPTLEDAEMKQAISGASRLTVLVATSEKLDRRSIFKALDWTSIDVLVTELRATDRRLEQYRPLVELR